jgi:hypothetical protein
MAHDGLQGVVSAARPDNETRNICTHTKEKIKDLVELCVFFAQIAQGKTSAREEIMARGIIHSEHGVKSI